MRLRQMVDRIEVTPPRIEDYAPKALRAVESALVEEPRPMPNSSDAVVKSFLDMAEMIAKSMEQMGDKCEEQGKARKAEWYNAAKVARKKGEYQAREAGEYIDDLGKLRAISEKPASVINSLPPEAPSEPPKPEPEKEVL